MSKKVGVVGMGSFGAAISSLLSAKSDVILYGRNRKKVEDFNKNHTFKNKTFPDNVVATCSLKEVADQCDLIFIVIPSKNLRSLMKEFSPYLTPAKIIIHGIKGLDIEELDITDSDYQKFDKEKVKTMSEVITEESSVVRVGALSGPNLAREILDGQPTATVVASEFQEVTKIVQEKLTGNKFYVFSSKDIKSAEFGGVLKNIIALGSGILAGKGLGKNIQAMLITRGLREMIIFGEFLGAEKEAFLGTAGIGDLVATATSDLSRNFTFGKRLGQGEKMEEILDTMNEVVEGVRTLYIGMMLARKYKLQTPITYILYKMVFDNYNMENAIQHLMRVPYAQDVDFL